MSRPFNESRQAALLANCKTYIGAPHSKCGTTERYVKGGGCVRCGRAIATEQREALKARQAAEQQAINQAGKEGIDNDATPDKSAFEQSIDEIL
jgi:hypothetical protein